MSISRRDFLKGASALGAGAVLNEIPRLPEMEKEQTLKISDYLNEVEGGFTIDLERISRESSFLKMRDDADFYGYVFENRSENFILIDFSGLDGKKIILDPQQIKKAPIPNKEAVVYEEGSEVPGYGELSAGLIFEGNFIISGTEVSEDLSDIKGPTGLKTEYPTLFPKNCDSAIYVKGVDGSEVSMCVIKGIVINGTTISKDLNSSPECPNPAIVVFENSDGFIQESYIEVDQTSLDDGINMGLDAANAQISCGVSSVSTNGKLNKIAIAHTDINSPWDCVQLTGNVEANIIYSNFTQEDMVGRGASLGAVRGARFKAVSTSFNGDKPPISTNDALYETESIEAVMQDCVISSRMYLSRIAGDSDYTLENTDCLLKGLTTNVENPTVTGGSLRWDNDLSPLFAVFGFFNTNSRIELKNVDFKFGDIIDAFQGQFVNLMSFGIFEEDDLLSQNFDEIFAARFNVENFKLPDGTVIDSKIIADKVRSIMIDIGVPAQYNINVIYDISKKTLGVGLTKYEDWEIFISVFSYL